MPRFSAEDYERPEFVRCSICGEDITLLPLGFNGYEFRTQPYWICCDNCDEKQREKFRLSQKKSWVKKLFDRIVHQKK